MVDGSGVAWAGVCNVVPRHRKLGRQGRPVGQAVVGWCGHQKGKENDPWQAGYEKKEERGVGLAKRNRPEAV
jgi:hypothetical protein